jgi:hypothetical protein
MPREEDQCAECDVGKDVRIVAGIKVERLDARPCTSHVADCGVVKIEARWRAKGHRSEVEKR